MTLQYLISILGDFAYLTHRFKLAALAFNKTITYIEFNTEVDEPIEVWLDKNVLSRITNWGKIKCVALEPEPCGRVINRHIAFYNDAKNVISFLRLTPFYAIFGSDITTTCKLEFHCFKHDHPELVTILRSLETSCSSK